MLHNFISVKKKLHVFYSGQVQGVGFRYTAQEIAQQLKIYGWVKNLANQRVELIAEAEELDLNSFLEQISQQFSKYIQEVKIDWQPASGEFRDFQVLF